MQTLRNKNGKWWFKTISCLVLFLIIGIFSYVKTNFILNGVKIDAQIEKKNNSSIAFINGKAEKAIRLTLNGREIFIDKDGSFKEQIALLPGLSVISIDAQDKFGKFANQKFEVLYEENVGTFAYNKGEIINQQN